MVAGTPISRNAPHVRQADDGGRERDADGGERRDRAAMIHETFEIDVQRAGEEQEAEHPVQQRLVEVDLAEKALDRRPELERGKRGLDQHDQQRAAERHEQRAAGQREAQEPVVDVPERGRDRHEHRRDIECVHACGILFRYSGAAFI